MARELFIDTSGFFALVARRDPMHPEACSVLREAQAAKRRIITTDYVLDETATLLKARSENTLIEPLFRSVFQSSACRVEWTDESRFLRVRAFFAKHIDQRWSFTDCLSFLVMKEFRLAEALTADRHFEHAGFVALLR